MSGLNWMKACSGMVMIYARSVKNSAIAKGIMIKPNRFFNMRSVGNKMKIIIDTNPFDPGFRKRIAFKNYRTILFQKELFFPTADEPLAEIKKIFQFSLRLPNWLLKNYSEYLVKKNMYSDAARYMKAIITGQKINEKFDLTREIPSFLRQMVSDKFLAIYDTEKLVYRKHIDYYEEGEYVPMAGRGELVYQLDGIELFRILRWMS